MATIHSGYNNTSSNEISVYDMGNGTTTDFNIPIRVGDGASTDFNIPLDSSIIENYNLSGFDHKNVDIYFPPPYLNTFSVTIEKIKRFASILNDEFQIILNQDN